MIVNSSDRDAMPRIMPFELESVDQPDVGLHAVEKLRKLANVVLAVAIGIENEILPRGFKTAWQCGAISAIFGMGDHAERGAVTHFQRSKHSGRIVAAAVVDHDHFEIRRLFAQYFE